MQWTFNEKNNLAAKLVITAKFYDKDITVGIADLICDDLAYENISYEQANQALDVYRRNPKNKSWPRTADIVAIVRPTPDSRDVAIELSRKIYEMIGKHGYVWEQGFYVDQDTKYWVGANRQEFNSFKDAVVSEIGEIGWATICRRGPWETTCESANEMDEGIFIAQLRDTVQSSYRLSEQGIDLLKLEMPKRQELGLQKPNVAGYIDSIKK